MDIQTSKGFIILLLLKNISWNHLKQLLSTNNYHNDLNYHFTISIFQNIWTYFMASDLCSTNLGISNIVKIMYTYKNE